ncbi:SGNH hydrolase-type esterase domain [Trinorchestia longiramus]|nr:SGNH hydrolase-type esterase domain [Trinorchestia longiramus]
MAGGKSKKAGSRSMIECRTCKMWVDLESCKGLTEMNEKELKDERKLKGGEDVRSKRKVDGEVSDGVRRVSERDERSRVNKKGNGPWTKVNGRRMIENNDINENEQNRINENMHGPWVKVGERRKNEMDAMNGENERDRKMRGRVRPVLRICGDSMVKNVDRYVRMSGSSGCTSLRGKGVKEICGYAEKVIDDMNEGMVIVQGGGNGLLQNGREATVNAIMKVVERARKKNVRVAVTSLLRRPVCNEEYERLRKEVNRDLHEKILVMKAESILTCEVGSSFLDMDDMIQAGCFFGDGVHHSQEGGDKALPEIQSLDQGHSSPHRR